MVILLTSQGTWVLGTRVQRVGVFNFGTDRVQVLEKTLGLGIGTAFDQLGIIGY